MELSTVSVANMGMVALISCIGYLNNNFFIFTLFFAVDDTRGLATSSPD
jgi:hypothetical protein